MGISAFTPVIMYSIFLFLVCVLCPATVHASPVWNPQPRNTCPKLPAQKNLLLEQVAGDWRLAYLFLNREDEGLDEESTCVVASVLPSSDASELELSLFIDVVRNDHVDRSAMQFPADIISPGDWKLYTPLSNGGYLRARVIQATKDHLLVTFCSEYPSIEEANTEQTQPLDWKSFFEESRRRRRSVGGRGVEEMHVWTAVLVKHNDISALKFVEYASVLMKHGYDVTRGELVSFGKCPVTRPHNAKVLL